MQLICRTWRWDQHQNLQFFSPFRCQNLIFLSEIYRKKKICYEDKSFHCSKILAYIEHDLVFRAFVLTAASALEEIGCSIGKEIVGTVTPP